MPVTGSSEVGHGRVFPTVRTFNSREREYVLSRRVLTIRSMDGSTISKTCSVATTVKQIRDEIANNTGVNPSQIALFKAEGEEESNGDRLSLSAKVGDVFSSIHGDLFNLPQVFNTQKTQELQNFVFSNCFRFSKSYSKGSVADLTVLLEAGADPDVKTGADPDVKSGKTALIRAAKSGNLDYVKELLKAGADPHAVDDYGQTALMWSVSGFLFHVDNANCTNVLLEAGADPNLQDRFGSTALMRAARAGNLEIVEALLVAGVDPNTQSNEGETALMLANRGGHARCQEALRTSNKRQRTS